MYILVDLKIRKAELVDANDLHRFHVTAAHGESIEAVADVLGDQGLGHLDAALDDDHVWINADAVRALGRPLTKAGWELEFDKMLKSSKKHGYLSDDGSHIKAHLEWTDIDGV